MGARGPGASAERRCGTHRSIPPSTEVVVVALHRRIDAQANAVVGRGGAHSKPNVRAKVGVDQAAGAG